MNIQSLFEDELRKREIVFTIDSESGRHALEIGGGRMLVSLDNLRRDFEVDGDADRVTRFVDTIIDSVDFDNRELSVERLYWCMEPNDYVDKAEFRVSISKSVDRVLVHLSSAERLVTWVTHGMLEALKMSEADASAKAFDNLARVLAEATIEISDIDNVALGY